MKIRFYSFGITKKCTKFLVFLFTRNNFVSFARLDGAKSGIAYMQFNSVNKWM